MEIIREGFADVREAGTLAWCCYPPGTELFRFLFPS